MIFNPSVNGGGGASVAVANVTVGILGKRENGTYYYADKQLKAQEAAFAEVQVIEIPINTIVYITADWSTAMTSFSGDYEQLGQPDLAYGGGYTVRILGDCNLT